jgi:hypothetical protein
VGVTAGIVNGPRGGRPTHADPAGGAYLDLRRHAHRQGKSTQELLTLYVLERFLARLEISDHVGDFILKGGMLMAALHARRATVDIDLRRRARHDEGAGVHSGGQARPGREFRRPDDTRGWLDRLPECSG